jgi:hypothetical protein
MKKERQMMDSLCPNPFFKETTAVASERHIKVELL